MERPREKLTSKKGVSSIPTQQDWNEWADKVEEEIHRLKQQEIGFLTSLATLEAENVALRRVYKAVINRSPDTWVSGSIVNAAEEAKKVLEKCP